MKVTLATLVLNYIVTNVRLQKLCSEKPPNDMVSVVRVENLNYYAEFFFLLERIRETAAHFQLSMTQNSIKFA